MSRSTSGSAFDGTNLYTLSTSIRPASNVNSNTMPNSATMNASHIPRAFSFTPLPASPVSFITPFEPICQMWQPDPFDLVGNGQGEFIGNIGFMNQTAQPGFPGYAELDNSPELNQPWCFDGASTSQDSAELPSSKYTVRRSETPILIKPDTINGDNTQLTNETLENDAQTDFDFDLDLDFTAVDFNFTAAELADFLQPPEMPQELFSSHDEDSNTREQVSPPGNTIQNESQDSGTMEKAGSDMESAPMNSATIETCAKVREIV